VDELQKDCCGHRAHDFSCGKEETAHAKQKAQTEILDNFEKIKQKIILIFTLTL
jgi:hypothetical protein